MLQLLGLRKIVSFSFVLVHLVSFYWHQWHVYRKEMKGRYRIETVLLVWVWDSVTHIPRDTASYFYQGNEIPLACFLLLCDFLRGQRRRRNANQSGPSSVCLYSKAHRLKYDNMYACVLYIPHLDFQYFSYFVYEPGFSFTSRHDINEPKTPNIWKANLSVFVAK